MNFDRQAEAILELASRCQQRGWVPAASGNLSARVDENRFAITRSGCHKGRLKASDILLIDEQAAVLKGDGSPSAETALHLGIYRREPAAGFVVHTHSVTATALSRRKNGQIEFEGYEMLKAFDGIGTHAQRVRLPLLENDQDVTSIDAAAAELTADDGLPAYLIRGHGLYTWGKSADSTWNQLEALEFLFDCEWMEQRVT